MGFHTRPFASTSKSVYELGEPFIKHYRRLRERFSKLEIHPEAFSSDVDGYEAMESEMRRRSLIATYLKDFILHPEHALYVTELKIGYLRDNWRAFSNTDEPEELDLDNVTGGHRRYHQEDTKPIAQAIKDCTYTAEEQFDVWVNAMEEGNEGPLVALLLARVVNVKKIAFADIRESSFAKVHQSIPAGSSTV